MRRTKWKEKRGKCFAHPAKTLFGYGREFVPMAFQLRTVRGKLTVLVGSTLGVVLAVLMVLSWLLHRQVLDEVDNRVDDAKSAFQTELEDDMADQTLTLKVMAADEDVVKALATRDMRGAREIASIFAGVYPELDILLADADGKVLTELGVTAPPDRIDSIAELHGVTQGHDYQGFIEHGCEKPGSTAPPAIVMAKGFAGTGSIVVCQPINLPYLNDTKEKLGLELALLEPHTGALLVNTERFPIGSLAHISTESIIADEGNTSWAIARFDPKFMTGVRGDYGVAAALDVTKIKEIVLRNLIYALVVLLFAAATSIAFGTRLATVMSRAIRRLQAAQKRLEQQDFVHVDAVKTGDELEDLATGFNQMVDQLKAADEMKRTMGKYMARKVMAHLLKEKMSLGGEKLNVTILFTDIRSFTSISETMDPQALVALLNEYFTEMVTIVLKQDGVVDKYIGDAIMVVFGAPEPEPNDALRAVRSAVGMREALRKLNERIQARGMTPLRTGIGIHTGEVIAGSIGHEEQRQYTVIGDAVNLASRLESATKDLGVNILISEHTYEIVKDYVEARAMKEITVKGRAQPVMTYEVLGLKGEPLLESSRPGALPPHVTA
jgi:adenylate cyclase